MRLVNHIQLRCRNEASHCFQLWAVISLVANINIIPVVNHGLAAVDSCALDYDNGGDA